MKYINLPGLPIRELPFYLAMEEYAARYLDEEDCFFMWQVEPTVIFGRNQLIEKEVNLDYCHDKGIHTYRRKSGGGCVYADKSNIMFSYITKDQNVNLTFNKYIRMVTAVLRQLGINAQSSGRNDITIDGKKVSGNAFYHIPGKSIVHGTMLFDTDMKNMVRAITPSNEKLISKGVESVRQHITTLNQYLTINIETFKTFVHTNLCDGEINLDMDAIQKIEEIEQEYLTEKFIYGHNPRYTLIKKKRIEGTGDIEVRLELKNNIIKQINLMGDYFLVGDLDQGLLNHLIGIEYTPQAIEEALKDIKPEEIILNLKLKPFINILF
jgi:lipoate---protein ligase